MRPLQLYIVCNLLFFLGIVFWNPFAQPLSSYRDYRPYTWFESKEIIKNKVSETIADFQEQHDPAGAITASLSDKYFYKVVEDKFNKSIKSQSKIFLIAMIPMYALLFMTFFGEKRFIGEHFVLACHFMSALLIYYLIAAYLVNIPLNYFFGENNPIGSLLGMCLIIVYLAIAFKRFYKVPTWRSVVGALSVGSLTFVLWSAYRMFLFYNIMFWM